VPSINARRIGSTVSQASGEGERPVLWRADLLHCLSALGLGGGASVESYTPESRSSYSRPSRRMTADTRPRRFQILQIDKRGTILRMR
jgi:hypothetical protein